MDLKDYQERLMTEPDSQDVPFTSAHGESLDHARARRESLEFESMLSAAVRLPVSPDLCDEIVREVFRQDSNGRQSGLSPRPWRGWMSVAASVLVVATALLLWRPFDPAPVDSLTMAVEHAFVEHIQYPEPAALASTETDGTLALATMIDIGVELNAGQRVTYLAPCIIDGVQGYHLVTTDTQGRQATIMFLPDRQIAERATIQSGPVAGEMIPVPAGTVAVFSHGGQAIDDVLVTAAGPQTIG